MNGFQEKNQEYAQNAKAHTGTSQEKNKMKVNVYAQKKFLCKLWKWSGLGLLVIGGVIIGLTILSMLMQIESFAIFLPIGLIMIIISLGILVIQLGFGFIKDIKVHKLFYLNPKLFGIISLVIFIIALIGGSPRMLVRNAAKIALLWIVFLLLHGSNRIFGLMKKETGDKKKKM